MQLLVPAISLSNFSRAWHYTSRRVCGHKLELLLVEYSSTIVLLISSSHRQSRCHRQLALLFYNTLQSPYGVRRIGKSVSDAKKCSHKKKLSQKVTSYIQNEIQNCVCVMMSEPVSISLHESSSKSKEEEEEETVLKKTSALRVNKANYHTALKICQDLKFLN